MLTDGEKERIRACLEALKRGVEGFRGRRPQLQMIGAVANTLARCRPKSGVFRISNRA